MNANLRTKKTLIAALLVSAGGMALASVANADAIGPGTVITSGDITFTNFTCSTTPPTTNCDGLNVAAYTSTTPPNGIAGLPGIQIQGGLSSPGETDVLIGYTATITNGARFDDAQLSFNGTPTSNVGEQIFIAGTATLIGNISVNTVTGVFTTDIPLSQDVSSISILKDIGLPNPPGTGTISFVDQTYSQVPEPATIALFGAALLGAGLFLRRRRLPNV